MSALTELKELVEAGDAQHSTELPFWKVWLPWSDDGRNAFIAARAYDGSLDAAKALHEAVLPGWRWEGFEGELWRVWERRDPVGAHESTDADPARAWLLAILSALIAQEGEA